MQEVTKFENKIAEFFGAPYAVATDSCTSAIELALRYKDVTYITCPKRTYLSVPMLADKLGIELIWTEEKWEDFYEVYPGIYDSAVMWGENSYIHGTMMCVSMQFQKHLSVGRLGVILLDKYLDAEILRMIAHDGREPNVPWRQQNVKLQGFHYYAQQELAQIALDKLPEAIKKEPKKWTWEDYPLLTDMEVFK